MKKINTEARKYFLAGIKASAVVLGGVVAFMLFIIWILL